MSSISSVVLLITFVLVNCVVGVLGVELRDCGDMSLPLVGVWDQVSDVQSTFTYELCASTRTHLRFFHNLRVEFIDENSNETILDRSFGVCSGVNRSVCMRQLQATGCIKGVLELPSVGTRDISTMVHLVGATEQLVFASLCEVVPDILQS